MGIRVTILIVLLFSMFAACLTPVATGSRISKSPGSSDNNSVSENKSNSTAASSKIENADTNDLKSGYTEYDQKVNIACSGSDFCFMKLTLGKSSEIVFPQTIGSRKINDVRVYRSKDDRVLLFESKGDKGIIVPDGESTIGIRLDTADPAIKAGMDVPEIVVKIYPCISEYLEQTISLKSFGPGLVFYSTTVKLDKESEVVFPDRIQGNQIHSILFLRPVGETIEKTERGGYILPGGETDIDINMYVSRPANLSDNDIILRIYPVQRVWDLYKGVCPYEQKFRLLVGGKRGDIGPYHCLCCQQVMSIDPDFKLFTEGIDNIEKYFSKVE